MDQLMCPLFNFDCVNLRALLFLDIDGVLNTTKLQCERGMSCFSPQSVAAAKWLLATADFEVVLCTSWREDRMHELRSAFAGYGLGEMLRRTIGATDLFSRADNVQRGDEIDAWLFKSSYHGRLAILDDEMPIPELRRWWPLVDAEAGLTSVVARQAADMLRTGNIFQGEL